MKRKIILTLVLIASLLCLFAITSSAASLSDFINVDLTLTDGTQTVGYLEKGNVWDNGRGDRYQGYSRLTIYADYTDTSKTIAWSNVKVFDGRSSEICTYDGTTLTKTGNYAQTLLGYPSGISNVTHFYYPQGSLIVADNSFTKSEGWNLEYLYVPKSVKEIGYSICMGTNTLTTVEFEKGSQLERIIGDAFNGCTSLSSINLADTIVRFIGNNSGNNIYKNAFKDCTSLSTIEFPETLEVIGYNTFWGAGLSGTIRVPNGVTILSPGAFLTTKIETLILGAGEIQIGHNVIGTYESDKSKPKNEYLKNIYIPVEATFTTTADIWYACKSTVNFYVIANEGEDCSSFISTLKTVGRFTYATQAEIDAGTAPSGYNAIIIEGYNKCDAFYDSVHHEVDDFNCATDNKCTQCNKTITGAISHIIDTEIVYAQGFNKDGKKIVGCTNEGCSAIDQTTSAGALFEASGYSTRDTQNALCGGYKIDLVRYKEYADAMGELKIGMVIANAEMFEAGAELIDSYGVLGISKGIQVELKSRDYSNFNCSINNFSDTTKVKLKLVIALYIIDGDGEISFVQAENNYSETVKIGAKSFKAVTLQSVIDNTTEPQTVAILPENDEE